MSKKWMLLSAAFVILLGGALLWLTGWGPQGEQSSGPAPHAVAPAETPPSAEAKVHATDSEHAYTYTCPMHPDVKQDRPGKCPECGMFLEADTDEAVEYYCPMHEDVVQDKPGKCPDCGMFLDARPKSE